MEWLNGAPEKEGWYWLKGRFSKKIIVEVFREDGGLLYDDGIETNSVAEAVEYGYQFAGPIPEPEE